VPILLKKQFTVKKTTIERNNEFQTKPQTIMCENVAHCLTNKRREDLLLFSEGLSMLFENLNMVGSSEFRLFCGKNDEPVVALCCAG